MVPIGGAVGGGGGNIPSIRDWTSWGGGDGGASSGGSYPTLPSFGGGSSPSFGNFGGGGQALSGDYAVPGSNGGFSFPGGGSQGGFGGGNWGSFLKNIKGTNWGSFLHKDSGIDTGDSSYDPASPDAGQDNVSATGGGISGVNGLAGGLLVAGGAALAQRGLLGKDRGTWKGTFEGAAGGAAIGFKYGGPIGAAIGAAAGFGIGLGEHLAGVESPENEAKRLVKQFYGLNIDDKMATQIAQIAKQKYSDHVSIAVRSPEVRDILQLFAAGTGQKIPLSSSTPQAGSLAESNGNLYQNAGYKYGQAFSFQSNLPVYGGIGTQQYPNPSSITLNVNGQSAADLLEGRVASVVTPGYVADAYGSSLNQSNGRVANSATLQQPGLLTQ